MRSTPDSAAYRWPRAPGLDGLRALAAAFILVYHVWLYTSPVPYQANKGSDVAGHLLGQSRLGVAMFFVLSGYLLFRPYVNTVLDGTPMPRVRDYFRKRAARILPCYYLVLIGSILLLWPHDATPGIRLPPLELLPLFAVFGQNFVDASLLKLDPPMWTLTIEVTFYLVLPLVAWLAVRWVRDRRGLIAFAAAIGLIGIGYNAITAVVGVPATMTKVLPAMLPDFAAGMLVAALLQRRTLTRGQTRGLLALAAVTVLGEATYTVLESFDGSGALWLIIVRDVPAAIGFGAMVAATAHGTWAPRLLTCRPVVYLGAVSYGFYLWHEPLMLWLRAHGLLPFSTALATPLILALSIGVAALSWHLVEKPILARARPKKRRAPQQRVRPQPVAQPSR